ncbi:MAG: contractile injection system tape measure protein [Pseudomonadota bacterium]
MAHRIRKQRWLINAPSQEAAFEVRQQLHLHLQEVVLPAFERAFDALAVGDDVVRVPRLTLHVKVPHQQGQGEAFTTLLVKSLSECLDVVLQEIKRQPEQYAVSRFTAREHQQTILKCYLESGRVESVNFESAAIAQLLRREAHEWMKADCEGKQKLNSLFEQFQGDWLTRYTAAFRLLMLLETGDRQALLEYHTASIGAFALPESLSVTTQAAARELPAILQALLHHASLGEGLRLRIQAAAIALNEQDTQYPLVPTLSEWLQESIRQVLAVLTPSLAAPLQARLESLTKINTTVGSGNTPSAASRPYSVDNSSLQHLALGLNTSNASLGASESEGYLAGDAGLVLVHPFIARFLELRGCIISVQEEVNEQEEQERKERADKIEKRQLAEAQLPRAAALLVSLLYGTTESLEFELTTLKVLLGLSPIEPLLISPGLLSNEDEEAIEQLLHAVIEHWSALGATSIDGLRTSFLQRSGILRKIAQGWQLSVERKGFDILLGQLPWGMSMVKLPWMPEPLFIEWAAAS